VWIHRFIKIDGKQGTKGKTNKWNWDSEYNLIDKFTEYYKKKIKG